MAVAEEQLELDSGPDDGFEVEAFDVDLAIAERIAAGGVDLPSRPPALAPLVDADGMPAAHIAHILALDPALAGAVARTAAAPLDEAIAALGQAGVARAVLVTALARAALAPGALFALREGVWRRCVAAGLVAEAVAEDNGADEEAAFLVGLLHDYGQVLALQCIEEVAAERADVAPAEWSWLPVIERHHAELSQLLAEHWQLPDAVAAVVGAHHEHLHRARIALLDVVHTCDAVLDVVGRTAAISLDDLATVPGVSSHDQAAAVARALARLPRLLAAWPPPPAPAPAPRTVPPLPASLRSAPLSEPSPKPAARAALMRFLLNPVRVALKTAILAQPRIDGLTTIAVARNGLAVESPTPLQENWVTRLEIEGPAGPYRIWVTVVSSTPEAGDLHLAEAKPLMAKGFGADGWHGFVEQLRG